jgi:hypothetical protein
MNRFVLENRVGSEYWVNSKNYTFKKLTEDLTKLPVEWQRSNLNQHNNNKILKPINGYAEVFSKKPELINRSGKNVLRQSTHAEIWVESLDIGIYALDKCWQRQFYPSNVDFDIPVECYKASYKFYTPWILDYNGGFEIEEVDGSPFKILNNKINFDPIDIENKYWDPQWIYFAFKNNNEYVKFYEDDEYCIIPLGTPMYDIIIKDKDLLNKLIGEYEE